MRALEPLRRIQWQLPLSIAGLLLAVVVAYSWIAYREVRRAAIDAAGEHIEALVPRLAGQLVSFAGPLLADVLDVARDPALTAALTARGETPPDARRALERLLGSSNEHVVAVDLWDSAGTRRLEALRSESPNVLPTGRSFPDWMAGDTAAVSVWRAAGDTMWFEAAAAVRSEGAVLGYLVESYRLRPDTQQRQAITDVVGMGARLLVGAPGDMWIDLVGEVEGPPPDAALRSGAAEYSSGGGSRLGAGAPVGGTPWVAWLEFPIADVLARPRGVLSRLIPRGAFIVLRGAVGGWALSRRVTTGLNALTTAAAGMADGDYASRVPAQRRDELGNLAAAFNTMAGRVEDAQQRLEQRVQERTAELLASREQFSAIATTAQEAIVTANAAGAVTYFNPGAERIFGHTADEVRGRPLTILMPERYRERHRRGFARYLETGESKVIGRTLELTGLRRDGSEFPVELSLSAWRRDGEPAFAGILRDVTARREAEEALERYASELQAVNEELEAFSYSVSHDLRAPLRSIHGFSQALLEDYRDRLDADGVDFLERVCAAVDRMGQLIDDLLELAQATRAAMRREAVDLGAVARGIADELRAAAPERPVRFSIADGLTVSGDARLLRLMMQNLLSNAWKFTSKESRAEIEVGASEDGGERTFFVRDNGAGFDMAYADQLFGAFQRLHAPSDFPGTGVGLALVQRIVHRHGGRIRAEGAVGSGATFHFTIPGS